MDLQPIVRMHTGDDTMTQETQIALQDIRRRDSALGEVATRREAEFALNDCRTLLTIIDELQRLLSAR